MVQDNRRSNSVMYLALILQSYFSEKEYTLFILSNTFNISIKETSRENNKEILDVDMPILAYFISCSSCTQCYCFVPLIVPGQNIFNDAEYCEGNAYSHSHLIF